METFTNENIREHLTRLLNNAPFSDSLVLSRFLSFIVEETLAGRSHELKEYTIAIHALKRSPDFNPQIDSIVRIHAGRLRRALREYYFERGKEERIQIVVPKGGYIPSFTSGGQLVYDKLPGPGATLMVSRNIAADEHTSLAVVPFESINDRKQTVSFIKALGTHLNAALTNINGITVVSHFTTTHIPKSISNIREMGAFLNASLILTGSVYMDKHLRIHVMLNTCSNGEQLCSLTFERKHFDKQDLFLLQTEVVGEVASMINSCNLSGSHSSPVFPGMLYYNQLRG